MANLGSNPDDKLRPGKEKPDTGLGGVIDELRSVLSDLNQKNGTKKPKEKSPDDAFPVDPSSVHEERLKAGDEIFGTPAPEGSPTDSDFWSGNVLGWPSSPAEPHGIRNGTSDKAPEPTPEDWLRIQSKESAEKLSEIRPESTVPPLISDPHPLNGTLASAFGFVDTPPAPDPVLPPAPPPPPPAPIVSPFEEKLPEPPVVRLDLEAEVRELDNFFPEPPSRHPRADDGSSNLIPGTGDPHTGAPSIEIVAGGRTLRPTEPERDDFIPIPVDIDTTAEATRSPVDGNIDFESTELKPQNVVQVACIFPDGDQKKGQLFVSNLKTAATSASQPVNLQTVFIHPWAADKVEVTAWAKSAVLAGADVMYILVAKRDQAKFKNTPQETLAAGIPSRLIYLEQVGLRTLYSDVLLEIKRSRSCQK